MSKISLSGESPEDCPEVTNEEETSKFPARPESVTKLSISNGFTIPMTVEFLKNHLEKVLKFQMRDDDVTVVSYPKSGTTWIQEVVWLICNNANLEKAKTMSQFQRYCLLDMPGGPDFDIMKGMMALDTHPNDQRRFIKTHLPFQLQPLEQQLRPRGKIIYIARNPKDECVSFYHMHRMYNLLPLPKSWNEFLEDYCRGDMVYGSWFDHVSKWWQVYQERKDSILFVKYESMKKDLKRVVIQLAKFMEKDLSEEQINSIVHHCSFKEMRDNKCTNWSELDSIGALDFKVSKFMRKGEVGDWKNYFTACYVLEKGKAGRPEGLLSLSIVVHGMIFLICVSVFAAIVTVAIWISTLRPIDRMSLFISVVAKTGLQRFVMRREKLCQVTVSNGFKVPMAGDMMKICLEEALKHKMRSDDIIVATYPKAGTTWMQEIVWLICNEVDIEGAKATSLINRYGFLESPDMSDFAKGLQSLERWPKAETRFIKTHLPFQLLPSELQRWPRGKMICVVRNPKDNCVSYYHFHRMVKSLPNPGKWSEFLTKFCQGEVQFGSWFEHVNKYWQVYQERKDSMYFVSFETLKKDLKGEVIKLAKFLEKDLTEAQIDTIVEHCTFSNMSKNKSANYSQVVKTGVMDFNVSKFMRKGEVGDWKNHFTINENQAFDQMYHERTKDWDLKFEFEIDS